MPRLLLIKKNEITFQLIFFLMLKMSQVHKLRSDVFESDNFKYKGIFLREKSSSKIIQKCLIQ